MPPSSLRPLRHQDFDYWKAQHLLQRAGFGGTPGQIHQLARLGLAKAVDYIIDYEGIAYQPVDPADFDPDIWIPRPADERRSFQRARQTGDEVMLEKFRRDRQQRQRADRQQISRLQRWWLKRMIETPRPLEEKMTLFWHGHFATGYRAIENSYHMFQQNQLFRSYAVGNFRMLTHAIIHDPAMLRYLNNNQNRRRSPNENLARELMELFTLGEGNGYSESDIKEGARALTGYTFDDDRFVFNRQMHDSGPKHILGRTGDFDGNDFVELIFQQQYASEHITLKLYRNFVNDLPNGPDQSQQEFILALARKFRSSDYDVKEMLRILFKSEHFYDSANVVARIKSPIQLIVQSIRSLQTPARSLNALLNASDLMGQNLFFPPSVKGWDGSRSWINTSTLFVRQNLIIYLLTGRRPDSYAWQADGSAYDAMHLVEDLDLDNDRVDPQTAATYLLRVTLGADPHPLRVETLVEFLRACGGRLDHNVLIGALSLIAAMPEYQLC